ncbi:Uu.00g142320.m01.CDS01 [Anthostomella pinea]|uniref:Uu.00g142320.m01.CDS01 n=1 Tax=Anthostomella pinea TaxID=933095 RepID=A0AAI8VQE9_9PEZI|nr:Uu.00g142320.m01.CDS01 [Anthostomella pinea]
MAARIAAVKIETGVAQSALMDSDSLFELFSEYDAEMALRGAESADQHEEGVHIKEALESSMSAIAHLMEARS